MQLNSIKKIDIIRRNYPELFFEQICKICGKKYNLKNKQIYSIVNKIESNKKSFICCSVTCSRKLQQKILGAPVYKNGVIDKIRAAKLNNIDENGMNSYQRQIVRCKYTKQKNHGDPNYNNKEQILKTSRQKDENGLTSYDYANISRDNTKQKRYNDKYYNNWKQAIETRRNDIDKNGLNSYQRASIKAEQTTLKKRGVKHHMQTQEYRDLYKDKERTKRIQEKSYYTKKQNGTLGGSRSKQEIRCFEKLLTKFSDAQHSYMDKDRYPFNCDAYIPSLDLFIEFHYGFSHGGEPFDINNIKHLQEVEQCNIKKEEIRFNGKKKDSYAEKIKVWTISDPLKLKTFRENHLNYKIFYTEEEFNNWINNL